MDTFNLVKHTSGGIVATVKTTIHGTPYDSYMIGCKSRYRHHKFIQEKFTCTDKRCQMSPFWRLFHRKSPASVSVRSTMLVMITKSMLYLVSVIFKTRQYRVLSLLSIKRPRMTATAELVQRIALSGKPRNKRTMNASTEVDEPRSTGNADHDLVTRPDFHPEYVAIKLTARHKGNIYLHAQNNKR